jgi:hypothetical protein
VDRWPVWAVVASGLELLVTSSLELASISIPSVLDRVSGQQYGLATDVDSRITKSSAEAVDLISASGFLCELGSEIFD